MAWYKTAEMMQRTANENAACLRRICKRSDQSKIERLVNNASVAKHGFLLRVDLLAEIKFYC